MNKLLGEVMTKSSVLILVLILTTCLFGQEENKETQYPFPLIPTPDGIQINFPSDFTDTLWVLKHSQYKRMLKIAKKFEIDSTRIEILEKKDNIYQLISSEKDSLIIVYQTGYEHYRDLWKETSFQLEEAEVKAAQRFKFAQYGFVAGSLLTALVGIYLTSIK